MEILSLVGIILGLALLVYAVFKGIDLNITIFLAIVVMALFSRMNPWTVITDTFMTGFVGIAKTYTLLLLFCALFGAILGASGAAKGIAYGVIRVVDKFPEKHRKFVTLLFVVLIAFILTYGGVNSVVIVFTIFPIASEILKKMDLPWHLSLLTQGGINAAMMLPGCPQVQNMLPMETLGTDTMAGPWLGVIGSLLLAAMTVAYTWCQLKLAERKNEGYLPTGAAYDEAQGEGVAKECVPGFVRSIVPSICLLIALNVFKFDAALSMIIGSAVTMLLFPKELFADGFDHMKKTLASGVSNGAGLILNVCCINGLGASIATFAGYDLVLGTLDKVGGSPEFQLFISVNVACAIMGGAYGGLIFGLNSLADRFLAAGINPEVIHRVGVVSCCGLDNMPHSIGVVAPLQTAHLSYKEGYKHLFWLGTGFDLIVGVVIVLLAMVGVV